LSNAFDNTIPVMISPKGLKWRAPSSLSLQRYSFDSEGDTAIQAMIITWKPWGADRLGY
jgi:hypothetical protein